MSDVDGIKKLRASYVAAQDASDAEGGASFWDDDCVLMPPGQPGVVGKEALLACYRGAFASGSGDTKIAIDEAEVAGDWSFERGISTYSWILEDGGELIQGTDKYLETHRRQPDGSWKFARQMWSSDSAG